MALALPLKDAERVIKKNKQKENVLVYFNNF